MENKPTTKSITNVIPNGVIETVLGVKARAIRAHRDSGKFPAGWYPVLKEICEAYELECPKYLFNFKPFLAPLPITIDVGPLRNLQSSGLIVDVTS